MMKIKFRAWDKDKKSLLPVKLIDFFQWLVSCGEGSIERNSFKNERTDRHVLMQCTGVKDRNNKDIYDGDVLYHQMQGKREVYYPFMEHVAAFGLRNVENGMAGDLSDSHIYEIIGNIYENPELLGGK